MRENFFTEYTNILISFYALSWLDNYNTFLVAYLEVTLPTRKISILMFTIFSKHITIDLELLSLQWLPISESIRYKVPGTCFCIITGVVPHYLSVLVSCCSPSHTFYSSIDSHLLSRPLHASL